MNTFYSFTDHRYLNKEIYSKNKELNRGAVRGAVAKKGAVTAPFFIKNLPFLKNCHFCHCGSHAQFFSPPKLAHHRPRP